MNSKWRIEDGRWLHLFFDDKWRHNDIICCRLRLLTCYPTLWFYQTPYYLDICRFMAALKGKIDEVWVLPINTI